MPLYTSSDRFGAFCGRSKALACAAERFELPVTAWIFHRIETVIDEP